MTLLKFLSLISQLGSVNSGNCINLMADSLSYQWNFDVDSIINTCQLCWYNEHKYKEMFTTFLVAAVHKVKGHYERK